MRKVDYWFLIFCFANNLLLSKGSTANIAYTLTSYTRNKFAIYCFFLNSILIYAQWQYVKIEENKQAKNLRKYLKNIIIKTIIRFIKTKQNIKNIKFLQVNLTILQIKITILQI